MSSLFSGLFGGGASGGIVHNGGTQTAQPATVATVTDPKQAVADPNVVAAADPADNSSLANLQKFWDTPKDAEGKPLAVAGDPSDQSIFNFDPVKVSASARKLDFTTDIDPTLVDTALGGGDGAKAALLALINQATQTAFAANAINTGKLINEGHATNNSRVKDSLPRHIKQVQLLQAETSNPVLSHPAAQPLVTALKQMAFSKDPNANPAEVTASVERLLVGLGVAIAEGTPDAVAAKSQKAAGEQDWSSFLN